MAAAEHLDLTTLDWSKWSKDDVVALAAQMFIDLTRLRAVSGPVEAQRWCLAPRPPMPRRPALTLEGP